MKELKNFNVNTVMTSVLELGVFFKDSGLWQYYRDDSDFENQIISVRQKCDEDFELFLKRVVLFEFRRDDHDEPLTRINYAIYCTPVSRQKDFKTWLKKVQ